MIVDSSALVAIAFREPGYERLVECIQSATVIGIGAPTAVEMAIVLGRRLGFTTPWMVHRILQEGKITIVPFDARHWSVALSAYDRFGRGRHPAGLNFGDALSYATAKVAGRPLLCVGADFAQTDLSLVPIEPDAHDERPPT